MVVENLRSALEVTKVRLAFVLNWFSLYRNEEFIPTFTKKIFKRVENLY